MITRLTWIVGLVVTTIMVLLYAVEPRPLVQSRAAIQDVYHRAAPRIPNPEVPIRIVDIDEASLREFGQWPWPRTYLAELTDRLFAAGAVAIGFDILFPEPDRTSPKALAESLNRFGGTTFRLEDGSGTPLDHDEVFAEALAQGPTVLAVAGARDGAAPPPRAGIAYTGSFPGDLLLRFDGALSPIGTISDAAAGFGGISLVPGSDGITRSVPMVAIFGETVVPSLSAELLRVAQGAGSHLLLTTEGSGEISGGNSVPVAMRTGALTYPLDENGHFRVHFSYPDETRRTSVVDILGPEADPDALRAAVEGRIIIVGSSAQALFDIRTTPISSELPGFELHASILEQIIVGDFLIRPDWMRGLEILLIALTGLLVTSLAARERPVFGLLAALFSLAALMAAGWIAFTRYGLVLNAFDAAVTALAVYLPATTINVFGKERARRKIRERFGHFLPKGVVDEIAADPEAKLTPGGAARDLSVMFVDMRHFTTITERMDPSDVVRMLNIYLGTVSEALVEAGATIDKFMGDAIMAFWNAPLSQPDHAERAVRSIFVVGSAVERANQELERAGLPRVEARIGLNSGPAFVGLMGSSERLNYSCVGDSVTVAARFEVLTRVYGVGNLVGEKTAAHIPDDTIAVAIDRVAVKGRRASATVYTVLTKTPASQLIAQHVDTMREAYLSGDWARARQACARLEDSPADVIDVTLLAEVYRARINALDGRQLPSDWDGNFDAMRAV